MTKFIIEEDADGNWHGSCPDLPGRTWSVRKTAEEALAAIKEFHDDWRRAIDNFKESRSQPRGDGLH